MGPRRGCHANPLVDPWSFSFFLFFWFLGLAVKLCVFNVCVFLFTTLLTYQVKSFTKRSFFCVISKQLKSVVVYRVIILHSICPSSVFIAFMVRIFKLCIL